MYRDKTNGTDPGQLKLAIFQSGDLDNLADFVQKNVSKTESMHHTFATGIRMQRDQGRLCQLLNSKFTILNENECFMKTLALILPTLTREDLFYPLPQAAFQKGYTVAKGFVHMERELTKQQSPMIFFGEPSGDTGQSVTDQDPDQLYASYGNDDIIPAICIMCSSGFLVIKHGPDQLEADLDYSPRGGKALLGLGKLLTGAKSFEELMDLAVQGSNANVDTHIRDMKGGTMDDFYGLMPDEYLNFNFGKACDKDKEDFSREDLAAAVVSYVCHDLAQLALNQAIIKKVQNIIMCGTLISHPLIREQVTKHFLSISLGYPKKLQPILRMCKLGPYLGVIGAWLTGMENTKAE